jgi:hypothetical protein
MLHAEAYQKFMDTKKSLRSTLKHQNSNGSIGRQESGPAKYFEEVTERFSGYEQYGPDNEQEHTLEPTSPEASDLKLDRRVSIIKDWNGGARLLQRGSKDYIIEQWEEEDDIQSIDYIKKTDTLIDVYARTEYNINNN